MAPFFLQRRKGAGSGRVFAFASIANQPHKLENRYIPGSGVGARSIANRRALIRAITYRPSPTPLTVGSLVEKDMQNRNYTNEFDPNNYPEFFPDMASFTDENIELGDKNEDNRLIASRWRDLGDDVFDDWGFFYLYDVDSGKYYFPIIDPRNQEDGIFATQTFNAFGRTFTITHGWAAQGIFKFDISVADELPFKFGAYGNMGSDDHTFAERLTQDYTVNGQDFTLYYDHNKQETHFDEDAQETIYSPEEQLYSYWIPKKPSENSAQTYDVYYDGDEMSMMSKDVTTGLIVYFAKANDVKDWVINDLAI
jgi:hypothetical protein